jgi:hypothetical protein
MKSNFKVMAPVLGAVILAASLATPASAARRHRAVAPHRPSAVVVAPEATPAYRPLDGRDIIGTDPDPQIRLMLRRDPGADRL